MPTKRMTSISMLFVGIVLTLAACGVESDVPAPSVSTMTNDELVTLIWSSPYSVTKKAEVEIDKVLQENPDMTSEEQTALLKQLLVDLNEQLDELPEEKLAPLQLNEYKKEWFTLKKAERRLCVVYPDKCYKTRNYSQEAWNLAEQRVRLGQRMGPQDAFRHTYWNSAMCSRIDKTWARLFANAHETEVPKNTERDMDLYNNDKGRDLCTDYKIAVAVKDRYLNRGRLKIVKGGPNGRLVDSDQPWP